MRRLRRSFAELVGLGAAAVILGLAAERSLYGFAAPREWLPDLATGWVLVGCGLVLRFRRPGSWPGALLVATGLAWFVPNFVEWAQYLHRGPLVQLVLTTPHGRPQRRLEAAAVAGGYASAAVTVLWGSPRVTIAVALLLVAVATRLYGTSVGAERRRRANGLRATALLSATFAATAALHLASGSGAAQTFALHTYQAALGVLAIYCVATTLRSSWDRVPVIDLVVELGETRSTTLRDGLAQALGDPTLEIGYVVGEPGRFVDAAGRELVLPAPADGRATTVVERGGKPVAVLVHDPALLGDPSLADALASATNLAAANARLQAELRERVAEVAASRRRVLAARDAERDRLERRLREGAQRNLDELAVTLRGAGAPAAEHALAEVQEELQRFAAGVHPRELTEQGLAIALERLSRRFPAPVELDVSAAEMPNDVEACVYFVCSEALANVAKHASASRVAISVTDDGDRVVARIQDDGAGGADGRSGTGLRGLADRVETLGGRLSVDSPLGAGTRLTVELPRRP